MIVQLKLSAIRETRWYEFIVRFEVAPRSGTAFGGG
jgi:hypothetical protein